MTRRLFLSVSPQLQNFNSSTMRRYILRYDITTQESMSSSPLTLGRQFMSSHPGKKRAVFAYMIALLSCSRYGVAFLFFPSKA
jgi:hypothetical protein